MLIVFSGVSGSGKNTIMNELLKRRKDTYILNYSSGTTRPPRDTDSEYNTYKYMTKEEFEQGIAEGKFFEYELVHGYYYGILNEALERVVENQDKDFMRDIDVHGCMKIKEHLSKRCKVLTIFLDAPVDEIRRRLLNRGETPERAEVRISRGDMERSYKQYYDLQIENLDMEKTIKIICDYIEKLKK